MADSGVKCADGEAGQTQSPAPAPAPELVQAMMEQMLPVMQRMLGLKAAAGGAAAPSLQPAANVARLPSAPAPRLRASATLREFESWKYMFEAHVAAHFGNEMSPVMQQAVLLSALDEEWVRIVRFGLPVPEGSDLRTVVAAMHAHLRRQRNTAIDRREFDIRVQEAGEPIDEFVCALKEIASSCDFCRHCFNDRLRDRVVVGTSDEHARRRILETPDLTFQQTVDIARASEVAAADSSAISGSGALGRARLSRYQGERGRAASQPGRESSPRGRAATPGARRTRHRTEEPRYSPSLSSSQGSSLERPPSPLEELCGRCGRRSHAEARSCPARGQSCRSCGTVGHFSAVCVSAGGANGGRQISGDSGRGQQVSRLTRRASADGEARIVDKKPRSARVADVLGRGSAAHPSPRVRMMLRRADGEWMETQWTPDTGAETSALSLRSAEKMGLRRESLTKTSCKLYNADNKPMDCLGTGVVTLRLADVVCDVQVAVVHGLHGPLLSWHDCIRFGILPADFPAQMSMMRATVETADETPAAAARGRQRDSERPTETQPTRASQSALPAHESERSAGRRRTARDPADDRRPGESADGRRQSAQRPAEPGDPSAAMRRRRETVSDQPAQPRPPPGRRGEVGERGDGAESPPQPAAQGGGRAESPRQPTTQRGGRAEPGVEPRRSQPCWPLPGRRADGPPSVEERRAHFEDMKTAFPTVFDTSQLREMVGSPMKIELTEDAVPVAQSTARNIPFCWRQEVKEQLDELVASGVIEPAEHPTPWVHPIVPVAKRAADGSVSGCRIAIDFTNLNKYVKRPVYPQRTPHEAVAAIERGASYFTKLDAKSGYHQIPLREEDRDLTTFITPFGRFRCLRASFGLVHSGDEYNRRGDAALGDIPKTCKVVDDLLAYDSDYRSHLQHVWDILRRCEAHGITLNPEKCDFAAEEVDFCGFRVTTDGYTADTKKLRAVADFPKPSSLTDLRSFLGLAAQLGEFSDEVAAAAEPLRQLLRPKNAWVWTAEQDRAFEAVKRALVAAPVLAYFDPRRRTQLETDAARTGGLGFCLRQQDDAGSWHLIQCGSRFLSDAESRYATIELELLAVAWACKKCALYISGLQRLEVVTDHRPLIPIINQKSLADIENPRLQRLRARLTPYNIAAVWRAGKLHAIPDALSRAPVEDPEADDEEAE